MSNNGHPPAGYPVHPYAEIFPLHDGKPLYELRADIGANGQTDDIVLFNDMVLDGRRRQMCCIALNVEPRYTHFTGTAEDALKFVISKNLKRRHLGEAERAMVAANVANLKKGGDRRSTDFKPADTGLKPETTTIADAGVSQQRAADMMNVSVDAVGKAKKVQEKGTAELQDAVKSGDVSLTDAAKVATEEPKVQKEAVDAVKKKKAKTAAAAAKAAKEKKPPKPGQPTFDDRPIDQLIGKLIKNFDARGNALGKSPEYNACVSAMERVNTTWRQWQVKTK